MLNISKQIYAGIDTSAITDGLYMAEILPAGDTTSETNKINRVKDKGYVLKEFDNIPLPGFTLQNSVYRSYDTYWSIIDPRGFTVKITSKNLSDILKVTGITEGLIQQRCVWVRNNSDTKMLLMPVSSKEYKDVIKNTELIENRVSIDSVNIGDTVLLQNRMIGRYMGVLTLYGTVCGYYGKAKLKPQIIQKKQIIEVEPNKFYYRTNLDILRVIDQSNIITLADSEKYINERIKAGAAFSDSEYFSTIRFNSRGIIKVVSASNIKTVKLSYEEISRNEADVIYTRACLLRDPGMLICEDDTGKRYILDHQFGTIPGMYSLDYSALTEIDYEFNSGMISMLEPKTRRVWDTSKLVKFYKIVKHIQNNSYI